MTEREHDRGEGPEPLDEEAAWAQIVAAYGEEPPEPPGSGGGSASGPVPDGDEDADGGRGGGTGPSGGREDGGAPEDGRPGDEAAVRSFTVFPAGSGPRDWSPAEPSGDGADEEDEGHFVPPEPPPLPRGDTTSRFAWLAVLGGPLLLVLTVLFQQDVTWWIATLGIGGFLGGFATLVARMRDDDDDDFDDPGRGAVV